MVKQLKNHKVISIQILLLILVSIFLFSKNISPAWDVMALAAFSLTVWHKQGRGFIRAFLPFFFLIVLMFVWVQSSKFEPSQIHIRDLIHWEKMLFGGYIPSAYLQNIINDQTLANIINPLSNIFYLSHFVNPVILALILWYLFPASYWLFMGGFLFLNITGMMSWIKFPAAPPWWATYFNYLDGVDAVINLSSIPSKDMLDKWNPVAAMPSLHAGYAAYIALFCLHSWGRKVWWVLILPLGVGFSAVYLGHHYVIDILAGYLYAIIAFLSVKLWLILSKQRFWLKDMIFTKK